MRERERDEFYDVRRSRRFELRMRRQEDMEASVEKRRGDEEAERKDRGKIEAAHLVLTTSASITHTGFWGFLRSQLI